MGLENFIPEIWHSAVLVPLRKNLVHAALVDRQYEGELKFGDTLRLSEIGAVAVNSYTKNGTISWENLDSGQKSLLIDQQDYFAVKLDDIDKVQANVDLMASFGAEASYTMSDTIDQHLSGLYTGAGNSVSALTVSAGNVLKNLSNMQLELDEANVPTGGRYIIVPPWYNQNLVLAASGAVSATATVKTADDGALINGYVGHIFGFNILMSNNVNNNGTVWNMMAFNRSAIGHVMQITEVTYFDKFEDTQGSGVRGFYVYGSKVVKPEAMVSCAARKG